MKEQTWTKIVGVIGIILRCFGLLGAGQTMMMPKMIEMQKEMMPQMQKMLEKQQGSPQEVMNMMQKIWDTPEWFDSWCIISGIMALIIAGFYIFASIGILQIKKSSVKMFYLAAGISIGFSILKGLIAMTAMPFMGIFVLIGGSFGVIINIILLIVVAKGDKRVFIS